MIRKESKEKDRDRDNLDTKKEVVADKNITNVIRVIRKNMERNNKNSMNGLNDQRETIISIWTYMVHSRVNKDHIYFLED